MAVGLDIARVLHKHPNSYQRVKKVIHLESVNQRVLEPNSTRASRGGKPGSKSRRKTGLGRIFRWMKCGVMWGRNQPRWLYAIDRKSDRYYVFGRRKYLLQLQNTKTSLGVKKILYRWMEHMSDICQLNLHEIGKRKPED